MGGARGVVGQAGGAGSPVDGRRNAQAEGRLVVDVDSARHIRQRDDIDVVGWVRRSRLHRRRLDETWETLSIAIDRRVNPVTDRDRGASIRVGLIDIWGGVGTN